MTFTTLSIVVLVVGTLLILLGFAGLAISVWAVSRLRAHVVFLEGRLNELGAHHNALVEDINMMVSASQDPQNHYAN